MVKEKHTKKKYDSILVHSKLKLFFFSLLGEHALRAFIGLIPRISDSKKQKLLGAILYSMSALLIVNVVLSLYFLL